MSEKGRNSNEIPLEISENQVKKVSFCGERPLDLNLDDFGGPGSSVVELFGPEKDGAQTNATQGMGGGPPRQGL